MKPNICHRYPGVLSIVLVLFWALSAAAAPPPLDQVVTPLVVVTDHFAYQPDPMTGAARWVVEYIDADTLAGDAARPSSWRVDTNLDGRLRASDADFRLTGFDRGHLPASANYGRAQDKAATFVLSLAVPQPPAFNRGPMATLENRIRARVDDDTGVYIVTAPVYGNRSRRTATIGRYVPIPAHMVKAALVVRRNSRDALEAQAWILPNTKTAHPDPNTYAATVDQAESLLAADLFAHLPAEVARRLEAAEPVPW